MDIEISKELNKKINDIVGYQFSENMMAISDVETLIEDLISEIDHLKEEISNLEQDIQDNYRPIPVSEQVGISDRDFY